MAAPGVHRQRGRGCSSHSTSQLCCGGARRGRAALWPRAHLELPQTWHERAVTLRTAVLVLLVFSSLLNYILNAVLQDHFQTNLLFGLARKGPEQTRFSACNIDSSLYCGVCHLLK